MLNLSTKGRYATRIMIFLAQGDQENPTRIHEIAAAEEIPPAYVEQILMKLKGAGLVMSYRGAKGGYSLSRPADQITVADVLAATEGPICLAPCLNIKCTRSSICPTMPLWQKACESLSKIFEGTNIAQLVASGRALAATKEPSFEI